MMQIWINQLKTKVMGDVLDEVLKFIFGSHWFQQRAHLKAPIRAKNSFQKLYFLLCIISQDTTK